MAYKLTYFNFKGLGEPVRLLFHYMGQDFEDIRILKEDWHKYINDSPFGRVPILQIGSETYSDSIAICRYLGNRAGLGGATPEENLVIDQVVGAIADAMAEARKIIRAENEEAKEKATKDFINVTVPFYYERFDKLMKDNGGYLANGKLSWVDIYFASWSESMAFLSELNLEEKYPRYKALKEKVFSLPGIKEWVQKRPQTLI